MRSKEKGGQTHSRETHLHQPSGNLLQPSPDICRATLATKPVRLKGRDRSKTPHPDSGLAVASVSTFLSAHAASSDFPAIQHAQYPSILQHLD